MRQLERRRVLDAAMQSVMVELASIEPAQMTTATPANQSVTFDWSTTGGSSDSAAAVNAYMTAAANGGAGQAANGEVPVNFDPVVTGAVDQSVLEGELLDLSGRDGAPAVGIIVDLNDPFPHTATVNWGDGTGDQVATVLDTGAQSNSSVIVGSHTYADDGKYTVTVTAMDSAGRSASDTFTVTVGNVVPTLGVTPSSTSINEGDSLSFDAMFSDPGFDNPLNTSPTMGPAIGNQFNESFRYFVSWGDGNTIPSTAVADTNGMEGVDSTGMFSRSHTYADGGTYTVRVRIADDNMTGNFVGGVNGVDYVEQSFQVKVNFDPVVSAAADQSILEGELLDLSGMDGAPGLGLIVDPDLMDTHTATVNWGDGTGDQPAQVFAAGMASRPLSATHIYADDGDYIVTVTAMDNHGNTASDTFTVTVGNALPTLNVTPSSTMINEGDSVSFNAMFSDPGFDNALNPNPPVLPKIADPKNESFRYYVSWGDGDTIPSTIVADTNGMAGTPSTGIFGHSHTYVDGGVYTVRVRTADDNMSGNFTGGVAGVDFVEQSFDVMVNFKPVVTAAADQSVLEGSLLDLSGMDGAPALGILVDPDLMDTHTATVNWGDGSSTEMAMVFASGGPTRFVTGTHTYADDGKYTVTLTVEDNHGNTASDTFTVTVGNVLPTLNVNTVTTTIKEGQALGIRALFSDPGFDNPLNPTMPSTGDPFNESFRYYVEWGDGRDTIPSTSVADVNGGPGVDSTGMFGHSHTYGDDGVYTVIVRIADDNTTGNFTSGVKNVDYVEYTFDITVDNVEPALVATPSNTSIDEGQSISFDALFRDPGFDNPLNPTMGPALGDPFAESFRYYVDWGDGRDTIPSTEIADMNGAPGVDSTGMFSGSHIYADDGTYTVSIRVADDNMSGNFTSGVKNVDFVEYSFEIVVNNVRPTLTVNHSPSPIMIDEGQSVNFDALFSDPGFDNPLNTNPKMAPAIGDPLSESFRYHVNWGDGRDTIATLDVADTNGGPGVNSTGTFNGSHTYADDGSYMVTIRIADDNMTGNFASGVANVDFVEHTFTVTVNNVDPTLTNIQALEVNEGQAFVLTADADAATKNLGVLLQDPGFDNLLNPNPATAQIPDPTHEVFTGMSIDWGDGTATSALTIDNALRTIGSPGVMTTAPLEHLSHTYADDGDYTVRVTFRDDNGPFVTRELTITVKNVMPTLTVAANQTINESDDLVLPVIGSFTDPGFDNPLNPNPPVLPLIANPTAESFAYFIDWGDGRDQIGTMSAADINGAVGVLSSGSFGAAHNYADDGVYVVTVRLADDNMAAFSTAAMFLNGANGVDFVQQTFTVTVLNVAPSFVPVGGQPILGDDINTQGITTIHVLFSDPGYDNPLNPNTVAVGNPLAETFTYVVNWGDGTIDTIAVTFVSGTPMVVNAQTSVLASNRVSGSANVLTTGGFDVSHRYLGPPDPLNPTADITITLTLIDDNGGSVTASVSVGNPGIDTTNVAIDTTPEVPRLEFVAMAAPQGILDQPSATIAGLQSGDFRATSGFLSATSERYLMLVVIAPDGSEIESHRLSDEALSDLRGLFATLPDGRYKVFLVRTDNNTKRLVIEVYVRRGRVIDPSDKSEDTRDRPPTSETEIQAVPLDQNPLLERIPNQDQLEEVEPDDNQQGDRQSSNEVRPTADDETYMPTAAALRWATPVVGLALMAGRDRWSKQLDAAFEQADERDWNRLRRRGHTGRWWRRETEQPGPRMRPSNYTR